MRVGILISDPQDWTARSMMASFLRSGADAAFLNFSMLCAIIDDDISLRCGCEDLRSLDGVVVRDLGRRGKGDVPFRFEALQALESMGMTVMNSPSAIARAANKFATTLALQSANVPTPGTVVTSSPDEALKALMKYEKVVSKPLFGYKGKGIQQFSKGDEAKLVDLVEEQGLAYLQEFIASENPRDIRAFVVADRVMGAIYRIAPPGHWISNLARGGHAEPCPLSDELEDLALRANRAVGTIYSGVDLMETSEGLKVIEVNGTPSGKGIFEALGADVTEAIALAFMQACL
jgi:tetrahydromethanopterin:alpha-L-glutamate ligase